MAFRYHGSAWVTGRGKKPVPSCSFEKKSSEHDVSPADHVAVQKLERVKGYGDSCKNINFFNELVEASRELTPEFLPILFPNTAFAGVGGLEA